MPEILLKNDERERGVPLKGLAVKTNENHFLIGLSNVGPEVQKNLQLLQEYNWFDLPIIATDGRHSILALRRGLQDRALLMSCCEVVPVNKLQPQ